MTDAKSPVTREGREEIFAALNAIDEDIRAGRVEVVDPDEVRPHPARENG